MKKSNARYTQQPFCPPDCPFLSPRSFLPNTLPFYCDKYETYLTGQANRADRCDQCLGHIKTVSEKGLKFISTLRGEHSPLLQAFQFLNKTEQRMFVDLLKKTGMLDILPKSGKQDADALLDQILLTYKNYKEQRGSPACKKFAAELNKLADNDPTLLSRQNKSLLMNLFMVLDTTEKSMMNAVFKSPGRLKSFLKQFDHQPKDSNLLKDTRRILYEENDKLQKQKEQEASNQKNIEKNTRQQQVEQNANRQRETEKSEQQKQIELDQLKRLKQQQR